MDHLIALRRRPEELVRKDKFFVKEWHMLVIVDKLLRGLQCLFSSSEEESFGPLGISA
jgi:hypothetical protein